jgi:hypothetical protein
MSRDPVPRRSSRIRDVRTFDQLVRAVLATLVESKRRMDAPDTSQAGSESRPHLGGRFSDPGEELFPRSAHAGNTAAASQGSIWRSDFLASSR